MVVLCASAVLALGLGLWESSIALAQASSAPVLDAQRPEGALLPAPVGHRQPEEKDLPPKVRRHEGAITANQHAFDQSLDICRGC
jgi:hypothetical protein